MPTIVNGLSSESILLKNELFLPFLCIKEYDKFDEAMAQCNDSEYGLTAGIYSKNQEEINNFINNIENGVIYINR